MQRKIRAWNKKNLFLLIHKNLVAVDAVKVFMWNEVGMRETMLEVQREVEAALIPTGVKVMLQAGTQVTITQAHKSSLLVLIYLRTTSFHVL